MTRALGADFAGDLFDLVFMAFFGVRFAGFPLAAARIFALVSADGRLNLDVLLSALASAWALAFVSVWAFGFVFDWTLGVSFGLAAWDFRERAGARAFVFVGATLGNRTLVFALVSVFFTGDLVDEAFAGAFLGEDLVDDAFSCAFELRAREAVCVEPELRALEAAFCTPDLMERDFDATGRFLLTRDAEPLSTFSVFRLVLAACLAARRLLFALSLFFCLSASALASRASRARSFSRGRGPRTPRHETEPHRHCWTFFWE